MPLKLMLRKSGIALLFLSIGMVVATTAWADDYAVAAAGPPPTDELAADIAGLMSEKGITVKNGSRTMMELWLVKEWPLASATPGTGLLYPFEPGQLIGVVRFARKGADFREQEIAKGVYTLRYGQQPVDGAHVGTSPTRDFLLLVEAAKDKSPEAIAYKTLADLSKEAAESAHPALLSLQPAEESASPVRHQADHDWWIVRLEGQGKSPDGASSLPIEIVVAGKAAE